MADKVIVGNLVLNADAAKKSVKEMKDDLSTANEVLTYLTQNFDKFPEEAIEAGKRVKELNASIKEAADLAKIFSAEGSMSLNAFGEASKGIISGFSTLQGVMSLFGEKSEIVEKSLEKVKTALEVTEGLNKIKGAVESFKNLGAIIGTEVVEAFTALKAAIGSTGIGLIVVALGAIYEYWGNIKEAITGVNQQQQEALESAQEQVKTEQEKSDLLDKQDNILKLSGKSEKQILELKINQIDAVINATKAQLLAQKNLEQSQIKTATRNKEILSGIIQFITAPIQFILAAADSLGRIIGKDWNFREKFNSSVASIVFDPDKIKEDSDNAIKKTEEGLTELQNKEAGYRLSIQKINNDADQKKVKQSKDNLQKELSNKLEANKAQENMEIEKAKEAGENDEEINKIHNTFQQESLKVLNQYYQKVKDTDKEAANRINQSEKAIIEGRLNNQLKALQQEQTLAIAKARAVGASEENISKIQLDYQQKKITDLQNNYEQVKDINAVAAAEIQKQIAAEQYNLQLMQLNDEAKYNSELSKITETNEAEQLNEQDKYGRKLIEYNLEQTKARINSLLISPEEKKKLIDQYEIRANNDLKKANDQKIKDEGGDKLDDYKKEIKNDINNSGIDKHTQEHNAELKELENWNAERAKVIKGNLDLENKLHSDYSAKKKAIAKEEFDYQLGLTSDLLNQAADLLGKNTVAGKVAAIASATINTYLGATKALATLPPPFSYIQAALTIATGIKNIQSIINTQVPGQDSGGGAVPSASDIPAAPLAPQTQQTNTTLSQNQLNQIGNATVRAFVVESDVSNNQEKIARLNRAARLGN